MLRLTVYKDVVVEKLRADGHFALADTVNSFAVSFAKWRWHTLHECVTAARGISGLRPYWSQIPFKVHDRALLSLVTRSMSDDAFWLEQLEIVHRFSWRLDAARVWATGCPCHQDRTASNYFGIACS
jgi:hypothetical protein